ncbi:MAG TPA: hypothetical protein PKD18_07505 [Saprospiraceae bacterium]|nr:hypothetical protein [Saprospiraceae bacterium]
MSKNKNKSRKTNNSFSETIKPLDPVNPIQPADKVKESFFKKNMIAIIAAFISLVSLYYTSKVREHNRLTVTPKIQFTYINDNTTGEFKIYMKNKGIGTAIIDNLVFTSGNGEIFSTAKQQGSFWIDIFKSFKIPDTILYKNIYSFQMMPESAMSENEEILILAISSKELDVEDYVNTLLKLVKSKLEVNYHSFYKDSFSDSLLLNEFRIVSFPK